MWKCEKCGIDIDGADSCWKCGLSRDGSQASKTAKSEYSSTDQRDSVAGGDERQREEIVKKTRLAGFILVVFGLFMVFAVPYITMQQAEQSGESSARNFSGGVGSAAGSAFEGVLRGEAGARGRQNAEEARGVGIIFVIAGVAVLALARNRTVMDFLVKLKG